MQLGCPELVPPARIGQHTTLGGRWILLALRRVLLKRRTKKAASLKKRLCCEVKIIVPILEDSLVSNLGYVTSTMPRWYRSRYRRGGRGCLAGPVTAAAVILPQGYNLPQLNDSKKLGVQLRQELRNSSKVTPLAMPWFMFHRKKLTVSTFLNASILAMHRALEQLNTAPECIAVDGNRFKPYGNLPHQCVIKGDGKYQNIAAASILAKPIAMNTCCNCMKRFRIMAGKNKGYPTKNTA